MKISKIAIISLALSTSIFAAEANNTMEVKKEGIKYIKMLGMALKSEMKKHMKSDKSGLEAAEFCANKAMKISNEINAKLPKNVKVRRTALKYRNEANKPDELDVKVMNEYLKEMKEGKFTPKDIKVVKDGNTTRVYKPLVVGNVCLKCHGSNISPEIKKTISKYYPNDKAVGFKKGDLRGVIVAEIKNK